MRSWNPCSQWAALQVVRAHACLFALLIAAAQTQSADPQLGNMVPQGGQRGTEVVVRFQGARIGQEPLEVMFYEPGIQVVELKSVDANQAEAKLAIAPDCRLGIHAVRVRTSTGITNLRTFHVGALPEVAETEPNNEFDSPQAIELDVTVSGLIKLEDIDYFAVEAKKGERITAEIEGERLGRATNQNFFFDPHLAILNAKRFELASSDDTALLHQDAVVSIIAPEDGRYVVSVRDSAFGGNNNCTYRLHVGRFPRPLAVLPAGGRAGESLEVHWLGDVAGPQSEQIPVPTAARRDFGLFRKDEHGIAPSPNVFRINDLENFLEVEPNNSLKQASSSSVPGACNGVIGQPGDHDVFRFSAKKGQVFDFNVYARWLRSPLDSVLRILDAKGKRLAGNDDSAGKPDSYVRYTIPADGDYFIEVFDHLQSGGEYYTYRVEIAPPRARVDLQIAERRRSVATKIEIPRGNRTAFLVNAARRDFGGPLNVTLENLPAGVKVETVTMPADRGVVPVILAAAADAPLAGGLPSVVARPAEEGKQVESSFTQQTWLIIGRNYREVWSHYADRAAVAVANEAPFKISIVEPKVPIVQGGSMQLKVVAERTEGFKAPIAVRLLYNPPGISSSRSIKIAEGQTEATIPISAGGGAPAKSWDICVEGEANVNGRMLVATPFARLNIQAPFVALSFPKAAVELGHEIDYPVGVEVKTPFEGAAQVTLHGVPAGVTVEPVEITKETKQLVFHIKTTEKSPPGRHGTLLCRFELMQNGEPILHQLGTGELRIDKPLPPKKEPLKTAAK